VTDSWTLVKSRFVDILDYWWWLCED